jgi:hypothetical protein
MRTIIVVLLMCLLSGHPLVFAAEPTQVLMAAAVREAARLTHLEVLAAQAGATQTKRSTGHPVLIGAAIGAGVMAVVGYLGSSCSVPPPDDVAACGTRYKGASALLGAGGGAGVGALIGLAFRKK